MIALDIETTTDHNTIWCCALVSQTTEVYTSPEGLQEALDEADVIVGHNIIGFDWPVLERVWGIKIPFEKLRDTLLLSRLYNPELKHSLADWGERLGYPKMDFSDYDAGLSDEMVEYCIRDTEIALKLWYYLDNALASEGFSEASRELEHQVARVVEGQVRNGFRFDSEASQRLYEALTHRMREIDAILQVKFPPITHKRVSEKTGKPLKDYVEVFNIASRQQIASRLQSIGVKLTSKTEKGQIIVDESTLESLDVPEAKLISEYLLLQKRVGLLEGWIKAVKDDRIHGKVITNGAVTGRMSHFSPNMAQVPSVTSAYGKECRELFIVDEGNVLVGADASGLELRMLAHYMKDDAYTQELLQGDIHTANMKAAGLTERSQAKTFIYAFLYGAGPAKIGSIVGGGYKEGQRLIDAFLRNTPALSALRDKVSHLAEQGSLPGLDGRRLRVRSQHAALNTLLQGAGAIVMKKALVILDERLRQLRIPYKFVANVHDEWQIETPEWFGKAVGINAVQSIREAGEALELRCPLDGEYKIGKNWSETH